MTWIDLEEIHAFELPRGVLQTTRDLLWKSGRHEREGRVLWAGKASSRTVARITDALYPSQTATYDEVLVSHLEIQRINLELFNRGLVPIGQVHTHPTTAWHSSEDDHYPISTQRGSLSLVVPNFAREQRRGLDGCALFRLSDAWREIDCDVIRVVE